MSRVEAISKATEIEASKMFDNDMVITSIEFMFFSSNIQMGIINTYYFFKSNIG